jgi:hypothetical protein
MPRQTNVQIRRGASSSWSTNNSILNEGELGWDTTNKQLKIGNGEGWNFTNSINPNYSSTKTTIGNGFQTSFNINHSLNATFDVLVNVRNSSTGDYVYPDITYTDKNNINITFNSPPSTNQYVVTITGIDSSLDVPTNMVSDGIISYLEGNNKNSYSGSGTTWYDLSGEQNDGSLVNMDGANFSNNKFSFDGVNEYINTSLSYEGTNELTMGVWMKAPDASQRCGLFGFRSSQGITNKSQNQLYITGDINAGTSGTGCTFDDWRIDGSTVVNFRSVYALNTPVCDGNWHFIMVVRSTASTKLYVDNVLEDENSSGSITNLTSDSTYKLGVAGNSNGILSTYHYEGDIGASFIYNTALTASEIEQIYNSTKGYFF